MFRTVLRALLVFSWLILLAVGVQALRQADMLGPLGRPAGLLGLVTMIVLFVAVSAAAAACTLLASTFWPLQTRECREVLESHRTRCTLVGVLTLLVQWWLTAEVTPEPLQGLSVVIFAALNLGLWTLSYPAMASLTGARIGVGEGPWQTVAGAGVISMAVLAPLIGWLFGLLLLVQALGAAVLRTVQSLMPAPQAVVAP